MSDLHSAHQPSTSRIVEVFLTGNLSAMLCVLAIIAGAVALLVVAQSAEGILFARGPSRISRVP